MPSFFDSVQYQCFNIKGGIKKTKLVIDTFDAISKIVGGVKNAEVSGHIYALQAFIDKVSKVKGGIAQLYKTADTEAELLARKKARQSSVRVL